MPTPRYPALFQLNTRIRLTELSRALGRPTTLDDLPDADLDGWAAQGFDWVWLLSVWQTGSAARAVSLTNAEWRHEYERTLPDLTDDDIGGSGFAITGYTVHRDLGGDAALARLRVRMQARGLKLMLDFVPNHMAPDHPWVAAYPDYFVGGSADDLAREPQNYLRVGDKIFAYGRDPYFSGWPDTVQLNYGNPALQRAMIDELRRIAGQCDGVRCDMAMLVMPDIFQGTWGISAAPFWPTAIAETRSVNPNFLFMAEVYWDHEWTLQQQGFDFCYDKRLYDRLREGHAREVRLHFLAGSDYQDRLARFLENHDEPRAAASFTDPQQQAAALITFLSPGLRFFHQGQAEGKRLRISPHLTRGPDEPVNETLRAFYDTLLMILRLPVVRDGSWRLMNCEPAWAGNSSADDMLAFAWTREGERSLLVVVNYANHPSQCRIDLPEFPQDEGETAFTDLLTGSEYVRRNADLAHPGMYVDLPAWGAHVLEYELRVIA